MISFLPITSTDTKPESLVISDVLVGTITFTFLFTMLKSTLLTFTPSIILTCAPDSIPFNLEINDELTPELIASH